MKGLEVMGEDAATKAAKAWTQFKEHMGATEDDRRTCCFDRQVGGEGIRLCIRMVDTIGVRVYQQLLRDGRPFAAIGSPITRTGLARVITGVSDRATLVFKPVSDFDLEEELVVDGGDAGFTFRGAIPA